MKAGSNSALEMTRGGLLARNSLLNLVGRGAPMILAVFAIPVLIRHLGVDRFGVLTLAWMVVGYFSLFDFGIGRALTKMVAEHLDDEDETDLRGLVWTGLILMTLFGGLGTLVLAPSSPWLVTSVLKIPPHLQGECQQVFTVLAFCIPVVVSTAGLRGVLEAKQRFAHINAVRINLGFLTFLGPLLVLPFSTNLLPIVVLLATGRLAAWLVYLLLCLKTLPVLRTSLDFRSEFVAPILRFGGWLTVSNVISPVMEYLDRFLIGAIISVSAVTFYVTPFEVVTRLLIIPGAVVAVMFPAFSTSFAESKRRTARLFARSVTWIHIVVFPLALILTTMARELLQLWVGEQFAEASTFVLQCLALGVFVNSVAYVPAALLQGIGRPDLTAKFHMLELPFYLLGLWVMVQNFGIKGVAAMWLIRVLIDAALLFEFSGRLMPRTRRETRKSVILLTCSLAVLAAGLIPMVVGVKAIFLLLVLSGFAAVSWCFLLDEEERALLINLRRGAACKSITMNSCN